MQGITLQWIVLKSCDNMVLREFLRHEKQLSRQALTEIKKNGFLLVNNEKVTVRAILKSGDQVTVVFPPEERGVGLKSKQLPLTIVYEDDHLLVINKQANLPTIPSIYHPDLSLANAVLYYYDQHHIPCTFHAVNRLDKDTSGLLIVAKHRYAHDLLCKQQKEGSIKRTYLAIVHGRIEKQKGTITAPIGRKDESIIERIVRADGQNATTHYKVINQLKEATIVLLQLETGRTHQIRVHMAYLGHPLLGDDLYGGSVEEIDRQALHSYELTFYHPFLGKEMNYQAELPSDMQEYIDKTKPNA